MSAPETPLSTPPITPLDAWVAQRIGTAAPLRREDLDAWQAGRLRHLVEYARAGSRFYREHFKGVDAGKINSVQDLSLLPLMDASHIRDHGADMVCVGQDEVRRIITMHSSGTTGKPKRLYFSDQDLEATTMFFVHGMSAFTGKKGRVFVMLPGPTPDSTGDLLKRAVTRLGAEALVYGLADDPEKALSEARQWGAQFLIGFPVQILAMARLDTNRDFAPSGVLLCSDYIPRSVCREIGRIWNCPVYSHYGTIETGLGGAVECLAVDGAHVREADLKIEILDRAGSPLPDGDWGEITVTTLCRQAMPLVRYRTGDIGRILATPCACGSVLHRLDKVRGRIGAEVELGAGEKLSMPELDEALLGLPPVLDFTARLSDTGSGRGLEVVVISLPGMRDAAREQALGALKFISEKDPGLEIQVSAASWTSAGISRGKRIIRTE